ncbi:hypothetical protein NKH77_39025 [Streptomyces sp. M19]
MGAVAGAESGARAEEEAIDGGECRIAPASRRPESDADPLSAARAGRPTVSAQGAGPRGRWR